MTKPMKAKLKIILLDKQTLALKVSAISTYRDRNLFIIIMISED